MKILLAGISALTGKSFGEGTPEQTLLDTIKEVFSGKDAKITELEGKVKGLESLAADGKGYREQLVNDTVKFMTLAGDVKTDADSQKSETEFLSSLSLDRLKTMRDKAEAVARQKVPTHSEFKGKETTTDEPAAGRKGLVDAIAAGMGSK